MVARAKRKSAEFAYHVDHDKKLKRWDIVDDVGRIIGHRHEIGEAIQFAIRDAQHAHGQGDSVVVCVEQKDGTYKMAWSSR